jgi:hypothetical protein
MTIKRFLWCFTFLLSTVASYADAPEHKGFLSGKIIIRDSFGYFLLSDGSHWQVNGFVLRSRGFFEWWNGVQLAIPEGCECKPNDWILGSTIEAYPKVTFDFDYTGADNLEALKQCTHCLVNTQSGQILFGNPLLPADCLTRIYNDAAAKAYDQGYEEGFTAGKYTGYWTGYNAGLRDAR